MSQLDAAGDQKYDIEMSERQTQPGQETKVDSISALPHGTQAGGLARRQVMRRYWKAILLCFMCSFGALLDGYQQTIPGNIVANPGFIAQFGTIIEADGSLALNALHVSAWGGMLSGANIVGSLSGGFTSDWFGRKFNMALMTVLLGIGVALEVTATDWRVWLASKVFTGLGNGFANSALVVYNSEIAPPQIRGFLLSTWAFFYAFGQLIASVGLQILATSSTPNDYRKSIHSQWAFTGIFIIFLFFMPESPWYYARKGKEESAKRSLRRIYSSVGDFDVEAEWEVLREEIAASLRLRDEQGQSQWTELFRGTNGRRFMISAAMPVFGQLSGASLVFTYLTYFFQLAGLDDPFLSSLIVFLILMVFIMISWFTTDLFGRRPLLLGAIALIVICQLGIGISGTVPVSGSTRNSLIALACLWVASYASGVAPVASIFQGEASTPRLRAKTNFLSAAASGMFSLIFNYTVPIMLSPQQANWGVKTGYFFAGTAALGGSVLYFIMPEFKGREYAELDELFARKISARKFKSTKTQIQLDRKQYGSA